MGGRLNQDIHDLGGNMSKRWFDLLATLLLVLQIMSYGYYSLIGLL